MVLTSERHFRSHVILWFLLVAGLILAITGISIYSSAEGYLVERFLHQQRMLAQTTASFIEIDQFKHLNSKSAMQRADYKKYERAFIQAMKADRFASFVFSLHMPLDDGHYRFAVVPDIRKATNLESSQRAYSGQVFTAEEAFIFQLNLFLVQKTDSASFEITKSNGGVQFISVARILDGLKTDGLVVVEISNRQIAALKTNLLKSTLRTIGLLFVFLLAASVFFARKITGPFEKLTDAIERLIKNDFNFNLSLADFGGFIYLAKQFNLMLLKLQVSRNELVRTNKAYSRFVPHQLLKLISPNGIKSTELGDCIEKEMAIMFCDIRGFTRISESMPPQENFKFISRYLQIVVPVINKFGGTVDKYMGDGIMALFPNSPDNALYAAVGMMAALEKYNRTLRAKNLPIVEIGLGLHMGKMMLGTVGTTSRMDVTVVSDTVNACRKNRIANKNLSCTHFNFRRATHGLRYF
ncbi:MAG: adenylate/guanylate cyclase domain-containing protein [Enterobacterales bacterium]|nr:adenylate/guanylate cyclase domain-containing protein [Enterobacterales bacterium]